MKRFILKGLLAVVLIGGAIEATARWGLPLLFGSGLAELEDYYRPVRRVAEAEPITHLAVGSSQVAAAIEADTLESLLRAAKPGQHVRALNVGKGFSQQVQHYFGVRNLIERYPEATRGMTVFLEAPSGVADFRTWDDQWALAQWPSLLGPLLTTRDLPRFWLQADNEFGDKVRATAAHFFYTPRYFRHLRLRMEAAVNRRLMPPPEDEEEVDLTNAGGIRTDRAGVELTRLEAMRERNERWVEQHGEGGRDASDWEASIWADMVRLVRSHGGEVVFFDMPQSPVMQVGGRDQVYRERQDAFNTWARANDLAILYPRPFLYDETDFPDHLHLRKSRHDEYTTRLAEAYLRWEQGEPLPDAPPPQDARPGTVDESDEAQ
ncbi:MAG: hypothetical protein R3181_03895 [Rubricoccaceae bacterium]|nr:hypothetical protein [Rubricoccaceae bacterium]